MRLRRKRKQTAVVNSGDQFEQIMRLVKYAADELRRYPITVNHEVKRTIPKPVRLSFWLEDQMGHRYILPPIDVSYKYAAPVWFPLEALTGREEDRALQGCIGVELHYDPKVES